MKRNPQQPVQTAPVSTQPDSGFRKSRPQATSGFQAPSSQPTNTGASQSQQGVQTPFGPVPNLQAYQNQQDAFVQQFLQNQAQYNQGVMGGQRPEPVDLGATWGQAANNIRDGLYQGNPFATGNVDAMMGMFGQYGFTPPEGFRDQLISQLGQQSAPPMYAPQPAFDVPRPINPGTGLPYGQPLTDLPIGPNGEYWPAFRSPPPPAASPSGLRKDVVPNPAGGDRVRDSHVAVFPGGRPINFPPGWQIRNIGDVGGNQSREIYAPGVSDEEVAQFIRDNGGQGGPNQVVGRLGGNLAERGQPGPGLPPPGAAQPIPPSQQLPQVDLSQDPGYQQWRQTIGITADYRGPEGERLREQALQRQYLNERGLGGAGMPPTATAQPTPPGQQLPPGRMADWGFPGYTQPGGPAAVAPPRQPGASDPWSSNDPWSYPLLPGMRRGPSGEQIMTEEARQVEIRRREQETGMRYVKPRAPGQTGGWLPAPRPASQAKDQSAAMAEYIRTQATPGRARPTPTRTQGTRRR